MSGLNRCTFIGNLGRDAELKYSQGGSPMLKFSIAVTEKWTKDGEAHEKTEWINFCWFGKRAEKIAAYLTKGKQIYVEGKFTTRKWEDKNGDARYSTEVNVNDVQLLGGGGRGDSSERKPRETAGGGDAGGFGDDQGGGFGDDDIPFITSAVIGRRSQKWERF